MFSPDSKINILHLKHQKQSLVSGSKNSFYLQVFRLFKPGNKVFFFLFDDLKREDEDLEP